MGSLESPQGDFVLLLPAVLTAGPTLQIHFLSTVPMSNALHRLATGSQPRPVAGYLTALAGVALTTAFIQLVPGADHVANISSLYLLIVIATAYRFGSQSAVLASVGGVLSFDWFFVEPRHTFTANHPAEWLALAMFLLTAIVISQLTQNLRLRAEEARQRERETTALAQVSWAVASQVSHQRTLAEILRQMTNVVSSEAAAILIRGENGALEVVASSDPQGTSLPDFADHEAGRVATWVLETGNAVPWSANPFAQPANTVYVPIAMETRVLGVLYLRRREATPMAAEERRIVESLANHAAVALERHHLSQAEAHAEVLLEADKLKTALLSMVSHDFRSPLAAIKASVTGLLQEGLPWDAATQRELLTGIDAETDRLNHMVGDILALSRLEAEAWRPQCEMVSIGEVIGVALDAFNDAENERIRVSLAPSLPEVSLDSVQIVQVLYNLLENALKYSPPGNPVELRAMRQDDNLILEVMDRGAGLPIGEEAQIFERFYRAKQWRESSLPGSGLGLAICRGLVEAHGGQLQAANREGGGTVFRVSLPLAVPVP